MVIKPDHSKHYKWGNDCDGWHLLNTASLSVIKERVPKGGEEELIFLVISQPHSHTDKITL